MPTTPNNSHPALEKLTKGQGISQKAISAISREFTNSAHQDWYLLRLNGINKKLAETLLIFRRILNQQKQEEESLKTTISQAYLHYVVNTDGPIATEKDDSDFIKDITSAAIKYSDFINVKFELDPPEGDEQTPILSLDTKKTPCRKWVITDGKPVAEKMREIGFEINRYRYGRNDVILSNMFGLDEMTTGHTLENAMTFADLSQLAYLEPGYVKSQITRWGYDNFHWITDEKTDTQAFIATKGQHIIVVFRGTSSGTDALVDLKFFKTKAFGGEGKVHRGFQRALDSVWDQITALVKKLGAGKKIFISGHSLGAALAQLAGHRFVLADPGSVAGIYVYGSPKIGNLAFKEAYDKLLFEKTFPHINNTDIVTTMPPGILGFHRLGTDHRFFDQGHNISTPANSNSIATEEVEMEFDELDKETQAAIRAQVAGVQNSIAATTAFLTTEPYRLQAGNYSTNFEEGKVDDHGISEYLFKFACAIVDGEWDRLNEAANLSE